MEALLARVSQATFASPIAGAVSWRNTDSRRRLKLWPDVPQDQMPAAYLVEHDETDQYQGVGIPVRRRMHASVFCYAWTGDEGTVGGTLVNLMLQAIERCLRPDLPHVSRLLTLGGLVNWCRIEGRVLKDPGDVVTTAMLVVPVIMQLP